MTVTQYNFETNLGYYFCFEDSQFSMVVCTNKFEPTFRKPEGSGTVLYSTFDELKGEWEEFQYRDFHSEDQLRNILKGL